MEWLTETKKETQTEMIEAQTGGHNTDKGKMIILLLDN